MTQKPFLVLLASLLVTSLAPAEAGKPAPHLRQLDGKLQELMARWNIPGGSVTVIRHGRPVYTRGLGYADVERKIPVRPDSLFRIASLSKPITAAAILELVERGRLHLDDRVFDRLPQYREALADPRALTITIRDLLHHTGGWDSSRSGDPLYPSWEELKQAGASIPPAADEIIAYWLTTPLDFTPGARFAYSNFGYLLLSKVIESVTGHSYEEWTARNVLLRAGFDRPRLGDTLPRGRARGEVTYYDQPGAEEVLSVFSAEPLLVPRPYGGFSLALQSGAGGWLASSISLAQFLTRLANGRILRNDTLPLLSERPSFVPPDAASWYGLGFNVIPFENGFIWEHAGAFAGTVAEFLHVPGQYTYAAVFNSQPQDLNQFLAELQFTLLSALGEPESNPDGEQQ